MIKFFKKMLYALPFGMKGGDTTIKSSITSIPSPTMIENDVQKSNLGTDLLQGEVTQAVEELRFMDYSVTNESKKYKYIGDGQAIKQNIVKSNGVYNFIQDNKIICESVVNELQRVGQYGNDSYTLKIINKDTPRFRIEKYCQYIQVQINPSEISLTMFFSKYPNQYEVSSKAFINELEKNYSLSIAKPSIADLEMISFVTYKASGEDDLIMYTFKELSFSHIEKNDHGYLIKWNAKSYNRENLIEKFYSETMNKKYQAKEKKTKNISPFNTVRTEKCQNCGAEVNVYDADIVKYSLGKVLCIDCLEEELLKNNQINSK